VALSSSVSGDYFTRNLFPRLGIAEQMAGKTRAERNERVGALIARGDAEMGLQQNERAAAGERHRRRRSAAAEVQRVTVFAAGVAANSKHPDAARAYIRYLASQPRQRHPSPRPAWSDRLGEGNHAGGRSWDHWIAQYSESHQHPVNRVCHNARHPADRHFVTAVRGGAADERFLANSAALFVVGWIFQFVGHAFEGKPPEFSTLALPLSACGGGSPRFAGEPRPDTTLFNMRIALVETPFGKSTLAGQIVTAQNAAAHSIASLDLDTVAWEPGRSRSPERRRRCRRCDGVLLDARSMGRRRVLCGTRRTHDSRTRHILLFIDPGMDACLAHCRNRPWEPHKYASKVEQDEKLEFLLTWVRGYYTASMTCRTARIRRCSKATAA
jgi:hypothetical protein